MMLGTFSSKHEPIIVLISVIFIFNPNHFLEPKLDSATPRERICEHGFSQSKSTRFQKDQTSPENKICLQKINKLDQIIMYPRHE